MYDAIKFRLDDLTIHQQKKLIERFALFEVKKHDKAFFWHNQQNSNLKQNFGIYIKIDSEKRTYFELSLHKFFNLITQKDVHNYNDFDFRDANIAFEMLENLLELPIDNAKVYFYEYGLNLVMNEKPVKYSIDAVSVRIGRKPKPFTWDIRQKKDKLTSTEKSKNIRTAYIFYDKTFESKENGFSDVPDNLLRLEIKHLRPDKKPTIKDLKNDFFQKNLKSNFKRAYITAKYKMIFVKGKFSNAQIEIFKTFEKHGFENSLQIYNDDYLHGAISKRTFARKKKDLIIFASGIKPQQIEKKTVTELKNKIVSKLALL